MSLGNVFGAIVFFLLSVAAGGYGVVNLFDVQQTPFGPARVGPALPALQFTISAVCIIAAWFLARTCVRYCRKCTGKDKS